MRKVQASEAKTHLPRLLNQVARGETIIITRHGRPIARLVPETDGQALAIEAAIDRIQQSRQTAAPVTSEELVEWRREGQRA